MRGLGISRTDHRVFIFHISALYSACLFKLRFANFHVGPKIFPDGNKTMKKKAKKASKSSIDRFDSANDEYILFRYVD